MLRPFRANIELPRDLAGPMLAASAAASNAATFAPTREERRREPFGDLGPMKRWIAHHLAASELFQAVYDAAWNEALRRYTPPAALDVYSLEEGDLCPSCGEGDLVINERRQCSCHINPPCNGCVENFLACTSCGWEMADGLPA